MLSPKTARSSRGCVKSSSRHSRRSRHTSNALATLVPYEYWAVCAETALKFVLDRVKAGIRLTDPQFDLLDETLVGGDDATVKTLQPFLSAQVLREGKSHWALVAVLARKLWPGRLPTDRAAIEACPTAVRPCQRTLTRWNTRLRTLEADIQAAVQRAERQADSYLT